MAANVNVDAFIPQIWDTAILRTNEDNLVGKQICKLRPKEKAKGIGDTVFFNGLADPAITAYSGSISYEALQSSQVGLLIDKQYYYAFKVTDVEDAMANADVRGSQAARCAYGLKKTADTAIMALYAGANAGNIATADSTCDATTIISDVSEWVRLLEQANVGEGDRWAVIPPWVMLKLKLAGIKFQQFNGINSKGTMPWANELGIDMYVTNQVYNSGSAAAPVSYCMFGSYSAIVFEDVLNTSRAMPLESSFDTGVSGLYVWGSKVIKPEELGYQVLTFTAETAI